MKEIELKEEPLLFWKSVKGRKWHHIFKQNNTFYDLTTQDKGVRGNFFAIDIKTVDRVKEKLISLKTDQKLERFHCRDIYRKIQIDIDLPKSADKRKVEYYTSRLTRICYVLVGQEFLEVEAVGKSIYFTFNERFSSVEDTCPVMVEAFKDGKKNIDENLINNLRKAIQASRIDDGRGWSDLGKVGDYLKKQFSIEYKEYGCKNLSALVKKIDSFEIEPEGSPKRIREKTKT